MDVFKTLLVDSPQVLADGTGLLIASNNLNDLDDASSARTNLGVAIGSDVQAHDADLDSWAGVTRASGFDTFAATPSSSNLAALVTDETGTGALVFANSPTLVTPALGTPASGVVTNLTGTASININGTVGATTPSTGAFTTLSSTGSAGIGDVALSNSKLRVSGTSTGSGTTQGGVIADVTINSSATAGGYGIVGRLVTQAAAFTMFAGRAFRAEAPSLGAGSAVTNYYAFEAPSNTNTHTLNTAFRGSNASATGRYNLYMDGTADNYLAGNVGIGTTSPSARLSVTRGSAGVIANLTDGVAQTLQVSSGSGYVGFLNPNFGAITFRDGSDNVEFVRIDASGNVGIGTTSPQSKLDVLGSFRVRDGTDTIGQFCGSSGGLVAGHIGTLTNVPIAFFTNSSAPRLTIDTSGNVGIGTASPRERLELSGSSPVLLLNNTAGGTDLKNYYIASSGNVLSFNWANDAYSGFANLMSLTSSGNVGIGTADQFGGGAGVVGIANASTVPASNPTGGGVLYVEGGALKYRGSSGTVTTIANA